MNAAFLKLLAPFAAAVLTTLPVISLAAEVADCRVQGLRCEYLVDPLGIDEAVPRLSWQLASENRGERQTAYQILTASSAKMLAQDRGDLWDTSQVDSAETVGIEYAGKPLTSSQKVWWKVRAWDAGGQASPWSDAASWEMALLAKEDWHGQWIARNDSIDEQPLPLLRSEFAINKPIKRARVYVTGLGYYELSINGKKIGDRRLEPGYTRYDKRVLYATHDVTANLHEGQNALGMMLGNGWFNVQAKAAWDFDKAPWRASPRMLLELRIEFEDGSTQTIVSDETWKTADGPITYNGIYGGETYDARREQAGWNEPGFDDSSWDAAQVVKAPSGKLVAQAMHPIKVDKTIVPVKVTEPRPGVYVFDAGQNLAGNAELRISGPADTKIAMKYGERLNEDGTVNQDVLAVHLWNKDRSQQFQTDTYVLKGTGEETWQSRFVYHGFQYVEVTGATEPLTAENLKIDFIHSAVPGVGHFQCSNQVLNRIWENARWSFLSNLHGIPTDCPHREKNGWMADAHLACETALWNYDAVTAYEKWLNDMADEQQADGKLPGIVPTGGWGYAWGNGPAWDSAFLIIPDYLHLYYGDSRMRKRLYDQHRRYVDYLTREAKTGTNAIGLGDYVPYKTTTPEIVTSTAYHYHDARIVSETARLLGKADDAEKYSMEAQRIKDAFNRELYDSKTHHYSNGSQTSQSTALFHGLVPPAEVEDVLEALVVSIHSTDDHLDTGVLGSKYLLHALTKHGQAELAYKVASQTTQPSWGWWIKQGANTLWETWTDEGSHNHIFLGDCVNWYVRTLVGINPDPAAPGFKHITIKPHPVGDLTFAEAQYESVRGSIFCRWDREGDTLRMKVEIPANTTATLYLPTGDEESIRENNKPLGEVTGAKLESVADGTAVIEVGSGTYEFATNLSSEGKL
jgi:alpha-L-rhamnosidase